MSQVRIAGPTHQQVTQFHYALRDTLYPCMR
jgi:hypothetical protein